MTELVLIRHGQSEWNLENRFTGWADVDLSPQGIVEARNAAKLLEADGRTFDFAFTSLLKRAIRTLHLVLEDMDLLWLPIEKTWKLNERHYGALQGLNKAESVKVHGEAQVNVWRRSFATPPPDLAQDDPRHSRFDRRYAGLAPKELPATESLKDTCKRVVDVFEGRVAHEIRSGKRVIIAAHGNSLRALVMHLERMSEEAVAALNIPTGFPLIVELDGNLRTKSRRYLGDPAQVEAAIKGVASQTKKA